MLARLQIALLPALCVCCAKVDIAKIVVKTSFVITRARSKGRTCTCHNKHNRDVCTRSSCMLERVVNIMFICRHKSITFEDNFTYVYAIEKMPSQSEHNFIVNSIKIQTEYQSEKWIIITLTQYIKRSFIAS